MSSETIIPVDKVRIARIAAKAMKLLGRRANNAMEAYLASKFLTIYFEYTCGFKILPSDEEEFIDFVKEIINRKDTEPYSKAV